jgi:MoaA/NifB/PqqE/SkfB family radical SAM enzyme
MTAVISREAAAKDHGVMAPVQLMVRSGTAGHLVEVRSRRPASQVCLSGLYAERPRLVIWEVTRACALKCAHCRAEAIARRDPRELTTGEAKELMDQIAAFGSPAPLVVLTGGDPMWRRDLAEIVAHARSRGLTIALTPSGTAAVTRLRLAELRDAGLARLAVSLDAADPATHDAFRGVQGSHAWTQRIIREAIDLGMPLQINTTVTGWTLAGLAATANYVSTLPVALWAVFFLVETGRGATVEQISAEQCESTLQFLASLQTRVPFLIKTTEAPHYRRVAPAAARFSVNDGNGFVFVDHVGNICPSGFLPLVRGNVRDGVLCATYRDDPVFRELRDPDALHGRCGRCRFRAVCGGSRSRAFAVFGDYLGEDPLCAYDPGDQVEPLAGPPAGGSQLPPRHAALDLGRRS